MAFFIFLAGFGKRPRLQHFPLVQHSLAHMAYSKFKSFHRSGDMNINYYLNEFGRLYNSIEYSDMELLTGVLVTRVLKNAHIPNEKQKLVSATLTLLTYDSMRQQLNAIYL